jgi:hypothetical protein
VRGRQITTATFTVTAVTREEAEQRVRDRHWEIEPASTVTGTWHPLGRPWDADRGDTDTDEEG